MRLHWLLALFGVLILPLAAHSDSGAQVTLATAGAAGGGSGAIERFTLRFSEPMVPLGDPRAPAAATSNCPVPATGRWVDQQTFILEFAKPLPGGLSCQVSLRDGLETLRGTLISGVSRFPVDTGGPSVRAVMTPGINGPIAEDQTFLVATNVPADPRSVAAKAGCAVDGVGEMIAVNVLDRSETVKLINAMGESWPLQSFLESAGLPTVMPKGGYQTVMGLQCRRPLPPKKEMAIVWPKTIVGTGGKLAGRDQRFDFRVREAFAARFECGRVNSKAACDPLQSAYLRFTANIDREKALAIRLRLADGSERKPKSKGNTDEDEGQTNSSVEFEGPFPADTTAQIILPAGLKDIAERPLTNAERFPLATRFGAAPPLVKFAAQFGILESKEGGVLPVTVRSVEPSLIGRISTLPGKTQRMELSDGGIADMLRKLDKAEASDYEYLKQKDGSERTVNHTRDKPLLGGSAAKMNLPLPGKGKDFEVVGIPLTRPGFYVVELASPALGKALLGRNTPRYVATGALVTNMAVHFKWGREKSLVWVTALDSGQPVANAAILVTNSCTGKQLSQGRTDARGVLILNGGLPRPEHYASCVRTEGDEEGEGEPLMVSARLGDDMSFTLTDWSNGISPYDYELSFGWQAPNDIIHTVFDRSLVRVGETVNMKHLLRRPVGAGFRFAAGFKGTLVLNDYGSDTTFRIPVTIDAKGSGETHWTVPQGTPLGDYSLSFETGKETLSTGQSVRVDEYRLPTMRATITGPAAAIVRPATVPVSLFAGYLSGGGASQMPVTVRTDFSDYYGTPAGWEGFEFGGAEVVPGTRPVGESESPESNRPFAQTLPARLSGDGTAKLNLDVNRPITRTMSMAVEMDYADANGETLTASRRLTLFPSAVQLGVKTDGWMMKADDLRMQMVALDIDGKPISGQRISVSVYSREIITARRRLVGGFYAYDNQEKITDLGGGCTTSTDQYGRARCTLDPGTSGEVTVVATTTDAQGNVARAVRTVWLAGADDWWFGGDNGDRMDLIPERPSYKAGETARFQVRMPFRSATALVTVEREGVLSSYVTQLSGKDPVVEVKLDGSYAPNAYVSVMAVRGRISGWRLWLADLARRWHLPFFSREGARPTALVDLAKPSYRMGMAEVQVGWEGHQLSVDVKADKTRYAVRDHAQVSLAVKDSAGRPRRSADVAFVAVDEALLQLMPNESWKLLDGMMGHRSVEVLTSTGQMQVVGKRHYGRKAVAAGGGGGDASGVNREDFRPVLLWKGHVPLDAQGRARVDVPLSDALSSFRLVAIATDGAQLFGTGETSVRTAQNLSLYAGLPPLVRTGDWYGASYTLRNGSDHAMTVTAVPQTEPVVARFRPLTVTIAPGRAAVIRWNLYAPQQAGKIKWTVKARSADGRDSDMVTTSQDVAPAVPVDVWAASLYHVGEGAAPTIGIPAGALPGGWVEVALSDTLAPPLVGVRQYMTDYAYNCFEQQLSRAAALGDVGRWNILAAAMPTYLDKDGLLRYWPSEIMPGSPELTAYALAMTTANGFTIPDDSRSKMIAALRNVVTGRLSRDRFISVDERLVQISALNALARAGAADPALVAAIDIAPADMPTGTLADWIVALDRIPNAPRGAQLKAAAEQELRTRLVYEGVRLDLSDQSRAPWWMMTSGDEMAIKALDAMMGKPGWAQDVPRMMTGVAMRQWHGHWDTTPANAWGAVVSRRFATAYPASAITGTTSMALGGRSAQVAWPRETTAAPVKLPLVSGPMTLAQSGGAGPWATVSVHAAVALKEPLMAGYKVEKTITPIAQRVKGRYSAGDVLRVTLTVTASAERSWVVINDPIPPGATVIGDMDNQSQILAAAGNKGSDSSPSYVERRQDSWRGYYQWVPVGRMVTSYAVRLNSPGRFALPVTRVEAMYSPSIRAQLPNAPMTIWAR